MTELATDPTTPSDAELIAQVRGGDVDAYGVLFDRHREAAHRLARQLVRDTDTDDLVSESFAKVLQLLQNGGGPDVAFRAYLLTAIRRLHIDRVRSAQKVQVSDEAEVFDPGIPFQDTAVEGFERRTTSRAFASLPERWQLVLWHLEVEGQKPAEIAPLLGMSANSVSALAYRAREGLRQAYLQMHLADAAEDTCRWTNEHLGAYVREGLSKRDAAKVEAHLDDCRRCGAVYLELVEVNSNLRGILAPLLLGALAPGYLATASSGVLGLGVLPLLQRARDGLKSAGQATVIAAVAGMVAAGAVFAALLVGGNNNPDEPTAQPHNGGADGSAAEPAPQSENTSGSGQPSPSQTDDPPPAPDPSPVARKSAPPPGTTPPEDVPTTPDATPTPDRTTPDDVRSPDRRPTESPTSEPPPSTNPPSSTPPTTRSPSTADVGVDLYLDPSLFSVQYRGVAVFTNASEAKELSATIVLPNSASFERIYDDGGWDCSQGRDEVITCTGDGRQVSDIYFGFVVPLGDATTTAAVDILSDEEDPNTRNNSDTWAS